MMSQSESIQCSGLTRKGTRCSRKTKDISGYCHQHINSTNLPIESEVTRSDQESISKEESISKDQTAHSTTSTEDSQTNRSQTTASSSEGSSSQSNFDRIKAPHSRANFITDDHRIIVGAFPLSVSSLIDYGITALINLTSRKYDLRQLSPYSTVPTSIEEKYFPILSGRAPALKKTEQLITYLIELYRSNHIIYIHCIGGHGRAGMIASILYGRLFDKSGPSAIRHIEQCREEREDKSRNFIPTPETNSQVKLIVKMLGNIDDEPIPDRSDRSWIARTKIGDRK